MNKLDMAHDYLKVLLTQNTSRTVGEAVETAYALADAMQAEADKRITEVRIDDVSEEHADALRKACGDEWQPDWSQAPDNMTHFAVDANGSGWFFNREPHTESDCCWYCGDDSTELDNHKYQGNWQDSLRKRPQ